MLFFFRGRLVAGEPTRFCGTNATNARAEASVAQQRRQWMRGADESGQSKK
jgi:hypothetical protein